MKLRNQQIGWIMILSMTLGAVGLKADEGMWLYNAPPVKLLQQKYHFTPSAAWLEHLQKASIRFNSGGSGSFVSAQGLVLTNHHVGADALQKFGDPNHDYLKTGFYARSLSEEKPCLDLELNVLMSIEDVTDRVNAAVTPDMTPEQAFEARRGAMAKIEKVSLEQTGLRSDVVTLYEGGLYQLYRFKKYTDVRLVFAPEQQAAFFGGDPDNFEYPRYDLDICLFRVYENGKPAHIENYLHWSRTGAQDGELIFVSGHPGHTSRLLTCAELDYQRNVQFPWIMSWLKSREVLLRTYSNRSLENTRRAKEDLFGIQNSRKAYNGMFAGLLDPDLIKDKSKAEQDLRAAVAARPDLKDTVNAWDQIKAAQDVIAQNARRYNLLEGAFGFRCHLFNIARTLLRAGDELPKPNAERLREYGDAGLASLKFQLFSEKPIYDDLEQIKLTDSLTFLVMQLGLDDPLVQQVLAGKSPRQRATELIQGTRVKDVAVRKALFEGGKAAVDQAHDPMIELARIVDEPARAVRKIIEAQSEIKRQAHSRIAKARFAIIGTNTYPDATFTLRLAFGVVKGYEQDGKAIPFETTMAGLYQRAAQHNNQPPFNLPARWVERKSALDLSTPMDFVSTADIIGGNSGSPVVNRQGEFVGIIFDGNIQSLVMDHYYTDKQARAVSVHCRAIIEALRKVYDAGPLADELLGQ